MRDVKRDTSSKTEPDIPTPLPRHRRPYQKPVLTEYGPVANLTQNMATGSVADGGGMMMNCL